MDAMSIDTAPDAALDVAPDERPDERPDEGPDEAPGKTPGEAPGEASGGWLVEQRGSFLVGRCDACGYTTAARRARFSMETDMLRHGAECGEPQQAAGTPRE